MYSLFVGTTKYNFVSGRMFTENLVNNDMKG